MLHPEFGENEEKLFDYFPPALRWSCCGTTGEQNIGCNHHGWELENMAVTFVSKIIQMTANAAYDQ